MIDPEKGFTSDVITDPNRFVGRTELIRSCMHALNSPNSLLAIYGKRGVGKSSLLRQVQQMALGDYTLATNAGLHHEIPEPSRVLIRKYHRTSRNVLYQSSFLNTQFPQLLFVENGNYICYRKLVLHTNCI